MKKIETEIAQELNLYKSSLMVLNETSVIGQDLLDFISSNFELENIALYMFSEKKGVFKDISKYASKDSPIFHVYDPFILWLSDANGLYTRDHFLKHEHSGLESKKALNYFDCTESFLIMPLLMNNSLIGIVNIGKKKNSEEFTKSDMWLFSELQMATSVSISNSLMYERIEGLNENLEQKVQLRTQELKEAQEQLIISEKLASLGTMVAGIAHEVNTPAAVIKGSLENCNYNFNNILLSWKDFLQHSWTEHQVEDTLSLLELLKQQTVKNILDTRIKMKRKKELRLLFQDSNVKISDGLMNLLIPIHDKNILEKIIALSKTDKGDLLLSFILDSSQIGNNISNALNAVSSISRLVLALKKYSHLDQAGRENICVSDGIENTLVILHNQFKQGIRLYTKLESKKYIFGFSGELNQVWTNIIMNAIQALNSKHDDITKAEVSVSTVDTEKKIIVEIEDNGPGISPDKLKKIWDPFFTTKDQGEGTGLGLSIVKKIIDKHCGSVSVESKEGEWTKFIISFPLDAE